MKNKYLYFCIFLLLASTSFAQTIVTGKLISDENGMPIQLANIVNTTSAKRALTNRQGVFRIHVAENDKIVFTSVGFDSLWVIGNELLHQSNDTVMLLLHAATYKLKDVTIVYSNRKRDSIARVVAKIFKNDSLLNNNNRVLSPPRGGPNTNGTFGYTGAITELYYQFSKEGKDRVHFQEFVTYYREVQAADRRYNKDIIKQMTNLPDYTLDDYIMYCKMNRQFIIQASEYDLVKAIKDCERNFRAKYKIR